MSFLRHRLVAAALLPLLALGTARAQEPAGDDITIASKLDELNDALADREMRRDADAIRLLRELGAACDGELDKRERSGIRKAAANALLVEPRRPAAAVEFYQAAADVLARMGRKGAADLRKAFEHKKRYPRRDAEWAPVRATFVVAIGKTKEPSAIEYLCRLLKRTDEDAILAACGRALGHFHDASEAARKNIAKAMIPRYGGLEANAAGLVPQSPEDPVYVDPEAVKRTLAAIREPWNEALAKLTGGAEKTGDAWGTWWNDNKRKKWK